MISALVGKSMTLSGGRLALSHSMQCVVQGCGYKCYPWKWWWQPMRNCLKARGLLDIVPLQVVRRWYSRAQVGRLGRDITPMWKPHLVHTIAKSLWRKLNDMPSTRTFLCYTVTKILMLF